MKIEHVALWTADLDRSRHFYTTYFGGTSGEKYSNTRTGFSSYFLTFEGQGRLELMQMPGIQMPGILTNLTQGSSSQALGWAHIAFSVGSPEKVNALTEKLRADGFTIESEPRTTGDGYYESVVLDPDGNRVEITI